MTIKNYKSVSEECNHAITLLNRFLKEKDELYSKNYKLVRAENLLVEFSEEGATIWLFTLKEKSLIPTTKEETLSAGGEVFIRVNLSTENIYIAGYGE